MNCALTAMFLAVLTIVNFFAGERRVLYPPLIYSCVWCLATALFGLSLIELDRIEPITWWVIAIGALAFSVGGWLTRFAPRVVYTARIRQMRHRTASSLGRALLIGICTLLTPLVIYEVLQRGGGAISADLLRNARQAMVDMTNAGEGQAGLRIILYAAIFSIFVTILCLIEHKDKLFWAALLISFACCVLTTGRTFLLMLFSAIPAALMLKERRDNIGGLLRVALVPFLVFVLLFAGMLFVAKDTSSFQGDSGAVLGNLGLAYLVMPIAGLNYVLTHGSQYADVPHHTFTPFVKIINAFGFTFHTPPVNDSFVFVPLPTNVYTIYKFYFTDFGLLGMFAAVLIIGIVQTALYRRAISGGKVSLLLCAFLTYPAVLSIFDDAYSGNGITLLAIAGLLAVVYFGFLNRLCSGFGSLSVRRGFAIPRVVLFRSSESGGLRSSLAWRILRRV